jgi:hypothetical protein
MYYLFLGRTLGPFIGGDKVLFDVNEGNRCLDRHENVVSDMVSPLYWFLKVRNVLFVCYKYAPIYPNSVSRIPTSETTT